MASVKLIADSGATKAEWCLINGSATQTFFTQGISPYFLNRSQISELLRKELQPQLADLTINEVFFYGTGCISTENIDLVTLALQDVFTVATVAVTDDVMAAAKGLYGHEQGIACILGTGSSCCYYDGQTIALNRPGLGYALGDEGSGAYLGKKIIQYFLYDTFDEELKAGFLDKYHLDRATILDNVYKKPLANRYLASFTPFLSENRGHYMIENIIEDGINDFFFHHLCKIKESWTHPVSFVGGIAYYFQDIIEAACNGYGFKLGKIIKNPMTGLSIYHQ